MNATLEAGKPRAMTPVGHGLPPQLQLSTGAMAGAVQKVPEIAPVISFLPNRCSLFLDVSTLSWPRQGGGQEFPFNLESRGLEGLKGEKGWKLVGKRGGNWSGGS